MISYWVNDKLISLDLSILQYDLPLVRSAVPMVKLIGERIGFSVYYRNASKFTKSDFS